MNNLIIKTIFSFIWLAFILTLCMIWNTAKPLWLLIVYVVVLDMYFTEKKSKKS